MGEAEGRRTRQPAASLPPSLDVGFGLLTPGRRRVCPFAEAPLPLPLDPAFVRSVRRSVGGQPDSGGGGGGGASK